MKYITADEYIQRLKVDELPPVAVERDFRDSMEARRRIAASGITSKSKATAASKTNVKRGDSLSLSTAHSVTEQRRWGGSLRLHTAGSLVQVRIDDSYQRAVDGFAPWQERDELTYSSDVVDLLNSDDGSTWRGGKKGKVTGFSRNSRRYLLRECGKIDRRFLPVMFTLTYADDEWIPEPEQWKRGDLRSFQMKMQRKYGDFAALWRLELKPRQSGDKVGAVAPHFHLIVWIDPANMERKDKMTYAELLKMRAWVDEAWGKGRTKVEAIRSARGTMSYIGKYIAKADTDEIVAAYPDGLGRVWGKWGSKGDVDLWQHILSPVESIQLTFMEAMALQRYAKRQIWGEVRDDIGFPSLYLFVDDPVKFLDQMQQIIDDELTRWADERREDRHKDRHKVDELHRVRFDDEMEAFRAKLDEHIANGAVSRFVM